MNNVNSNTMAYKLATKYQTEPTLSTNESVALFTTMFITTIVIGYIVNRVVN